MNCKLIAIIALMTGCAANVAPTTTTEDVQAASTVCHEQRLPVAQLPADLSGFDVQCTPVGLDLENAVFDLSCVEGNVTGMAATDCVQSDGTVWQYRSFGETIHFSAIADKNGYRDELCFLSHYMVIDRGPVSQ